MGSAIKNFVASTRPKEGTHGSHGSWSRKTKNNTKRVQSCSQQIINSSFMDFFYERREGHEAGQNIYGAPFHHVAFLNKKRA
jgi:hypothetical protein